MTQLIIDDFKLGLDVRRSVLTAPAGSLQTLDNVVINAGGEIEKRQAITPICTLPPGTFGLEGLGGQIWVWSTGGPAGPLDPGISPFPVFCQILQVDTGKVLSRVLDAEPFQGNWSVAGLNTDGSLSNWWAQQVRDPSTAGSYFRLLHSKMYRIANTNILRFAGVDDPGQEDPNDTNNPGAGFIDLSGQDADAEVLVGMEIYYGQLAIFARLVTQLWTLDPDPSQDKWSQTLRIGAVAARTCRQFGTGDVLFLSDTGVRSLKAINASMAAAVNDVGSPIDKLLQAEIVNNPTTIPYSCSIVQPISGRYLLAIGPKVYVLSYYPSAKISAWSTFSLPFPIDYMTTVQNRTVFRSGDTLYMYGGPNGDQFDDSVATVATPMMSADTPTLRKKPISIDLMVQGTWSLYAGMLTNNPTARELVGTFAGQTYSLRSIPYAGHGTHIGLTLTTADPSRALFGSAIIKFNKAEEK